ncbi:MAG: 4-(cytidine 5'-diphospho)-2-C-methyl-D-erythritol kinase [Dehalococcoidales bacterium]|jgi:4-diphosphocytidyl-2-C-methyl-D-erythritol kinase|nr:4-(cytidine 5'-diphospho)-2-C-methyl-D-erythritol kinase [Dehalococcoidales bacterium]MDP6576787.1 4-(cytidine 5'-diphospho)-2-C-methyl-D-erythritol kinase [Dehalococcoidales bacterium]|tara:strand:+ start:204 stop:1070 length:867 start_codon:yes stop_codon:yes gene_type:complete
MLTVLAPAKLNLTLEVSGKRPDGYHEIRSVFQTVNLYDNLRFQPSQKVTFQSDMPDWAPQMSLVSRAVSLLQETLDSTKGATIEVSKCIPLVSGLGGDSSDAAAVLRGLNELWRLGLSQEELLTLATRLGSDVAFFLHGGTALVTGRGEVVTPLPPLPQRWVVLVVPTIPRLPGKTGQLYASLNVSHFTDGQITERAVTEVKENRVPTELFNAFENTAFTYFSELKIYRDHIKKLGADNVHLAGSGPALFSLLKDKDQAEALHTRCRQQKMVTYLTETMSGHHLTGYT